MDYEAEAKAWCEAKGLTFLDWRAPHPLVDAPWRQPENLAMLYFRDADGRMWSGSVPTVHRTTREFADYLDGLHRYLRSRITSPAGPSP